MRAASPRSTTIDAFPPLRGYVETRPRERARTELLVVDEDKGKPLLASWEFGKGRSIAFTSDANGRWSSAWAGWGGFTKFWSEIVDSVRPERGAASAPLRFDLRQHLDHGEVMFDLTVFSEDAQGTPRATVVTPDGSSVDITLRAISRGRYEGSVPNAMAGKYEFRGFIGERKLTPVAFALSGELFGEKKGQGFDVTLLEKLASSGGGKINPEAERIAQHTRKVVTSRNLSLWFLLAASCLIIIEIGVRQLFNYRFMRLRARPSLLLLIALASFLGGCGAHRTRVIDDASKTHPLLQEYERGNRIPNPSFENISAAKPLAWNESGCEISSSEAYSGEYSLLLRALPGETATCISDTFPVTNGKYDFSVWLKAADLQLSADRFFNEALQIRLRLYDTTGAEISPDSTFLNQVIDSQDLSYSLNRIEQDATVTNLEFSQVHLVPRYYPYDEGWLPKTAAQARIELTLQGAGYVWLDNFDFHFSKYNFPLIERVRLALRSGDNNMIYPAPRSAVPMASSWTIDATAGVALCLPSHQMVSERSELSPAFAQAVSSLEDHIRSLIPEKIPVLRSCSHDIFTIIMPNPSPVSEGAQGHYNIKPFSRAGSENGVVLEAVDTAGQVYGLQTLAQLFQALPGGTVSFRPLNISDGPASPLRTASGTNAHSRHFREELAASRWLPELRLNMLFIGAQSKALGWWPIRADALRAVQMISAAGDAQPLLQLGILINPYLMRGSADKGASFVFSDPQNIERLYAVVRAFLSSSSARYLIVHTDDFAPVTEGHKFGYGLSYPADRSRFKTLAGAHAFLMNYLIKRLKREFPGTAIYFVPPWYNNLFVDLSRGLGQSYLKEICRTLPGDVPVLWTGPTVRSLFIDAAHVSRFKEWCPGHELMLWDNTLYARRNEQYWGNHKERAHLASLFEPYDVAHPYGEPLPIFLNAHVSELYRIQMASYADFVWNSQSYQPEKSLWNYLRMRFGEQAAWDLLEFDRVLWELKEARLATPASPHDQVLLRLMSLYFGLHSELAEQEGDLVDELGNLLLEQVNTKSQVSDIK